MRLSVLLLAMLFSASCDRSKKTPASTSDADSSNKKELADEAAPLDTNARMAAWINYVKPGNQHSFLASANGEWVEEMTFMNPGAQPLSVKVKCVNRMIMDGRYQESTHTGMFNEQPFKGLGTMGYDNSRKLFFSSWIDNMGTGMVYMEGPWDDQSKSIKLSGKQTDHETGKPIDVRAEIKFLGPDVQTRSMFVTRNGQEYKYLEIKMTRKTPSR